MTRWIRVATLVAATAALSACGGNDDLYGAIAYSSDTGVAAGAYNYETSVEAANAAMSKCGTGCALVLQFDGEDTCGAFVASSNGQWGVGADDNKSDAIEKATRSCEGKGGVDCEVLEDLPAVCLG
ncbi:DUF4189 domain-containing protein [Hydrogenophaga sp. 5NK40-0174]|uniref:DUF4189 domain-containing protein n=1 Tax=Hydrogenophaga sp. 5NK40-0174 TaxID=3127649 RepID=UPI00310768D6